MTLREALNYTPQELDFGTSGLRGLVTDMTDLECYINNLGFLNFLRQAGMVKDGDEILVAGDLRDSTPRILGAVMAAIKDSKLAGKYYGLMPTPALAYNGLLEDKACIMVTGSHIPADRNGIKFYKLGGEVLKSDEADIKAAVAKARQEIYETSFEESGFTEAGQLKTNQPPTIADDNPAKLYLERYTKVFNDRPLSGKQVVVYQHSAVGRDMLVQLLQALGADVVTYGRSDVFIPIDTENVTDDNKALFKKIAQENPQNFAIVSTDGDSDRPFVIDHTGVFYRGDILGCLLVEFLGLDYVAVPISSNDAVDQFCQQQHVPVDHTKIGSPYVIVAMQAAKQAKKPGGWEVNGGFLLGADVEIGAGTLKALPTRDAFLPILAALIQASQQNISVAELFAKLPQRFTGGGLVDNVPLGQIKAFKEKVAQGYYTKEIIAQILGVEPSAVSELNTTDGLRLIFADSRVVHFRPSGNAPQMRVYTNCNSQQEADDIVAEATAPQGYLNKLLKATES